MYQYINAIFASQPLWRDYDPYYTQKTQSFTEHQSVIAETADHFSNNDRDDFEGFKEVLYASLWGNKIDLSIMATQTSSSTSNSSGGSPWDYSILEDKIVVNEITQLWDSLKNTKNAHIVFVLDNTGTPL